AEFTLQNLAPDRLILGDPDTCIREFQRWEKATGASTFLLRLRHAHSGGPAHDKIMEAIRLFGERVLPHVSLASTSFHVVACNSKMWSIASRYRSANRSRVWFALANSHAFLDIDSSFHAGNSAAVRTASWMSVMEQVFKSTPYSSFTSTLAS